MGSSKTDGAFWKRLATIEFVADLDYPTFAAESHRVFARRVSVRRSEQQGYARKPLLDEEPSPFGGRQVIHGVEESNRVHSCLHVRLREEGFCFFASVFFFAKER